MPNHTDQMPIVIIAEDHKSSRETLARILARSKGCQVFPCSSAEEAHQKYAELIHHDPPLQPALLLTDRNLGAMSGLELLAQPDILEDHVMEKIMLTGQEQNEAGLDTEKTQVESLGARFYLKPATDQFFRDVYGVVDAAKTRLSHPSSAVERFRDTRQPESFRDR